MNIVVDGDRIIQYMQLMLECLSEYTNELKSIQGLKKDVIWESESSKKTYEVFDKEIENLIAFGNKMVTLVDFLNKFLNSYDESVQEIKGKFKEVSDELLQIKGDVIKTI